MNEIKKPNELNDEKLERVSGGYGDNAIREYVCEKCGYVFMGTKAVFDMHRCPKSNTNGRIVPRPHLTE